MKLIITHDFAGFDTLAAALAATMLYPGSQVVLTEPLQDNVRSFVALNRERLPLAGEINEPVSRAVVIATRDKSRLGPNIKLVEQAEEVFVYHHRLSARDNLRPGRTWVEPLGAVTTLLVEQLQKNSLSLTEWEATLMALGIYEETGCLTYSGTTSRDAAATSFLWRQGINNEVLQEYLPFSLAYYPKSLLEQLLENSELFELRNRFILFSAGTLRELAHGAAFHINFLGDMWDFDLTVLFIQMDKGIYMAAYSTADDLNLLETFSFLGVKGHKKAVFTIFKGEELSGLKNMVLDNIKGFLPPAFTAEKIAASPVITLEESQDVSGALDILYDKDIGGCPVTEKGKLTGMVSRRDLQKALRSKLGDAPIRGFMRRRVITASPDEGIKSMRRKMAEDNISRLPVVSEDGELQGIVTSSDILQALYRLDRKGKELKDGAQFIKIRRDIAITKIDNMRSLLQESLPPRIQSMLLMIGQKAEKMGVQVYLVGGAIRDLLLRGSFPKDLDFVVIPDAVSFSGELEKLLGGKLKVHEQFATASLYLDDGIHLDLVTARREFYAAPAQLPQVEVSSLKNDLYRRDFTINTLACSLLPGSFGVLYDFFEGRKDLERGIVRTLYNLSFADDPLRIIRAARFEQRFQFVIQEDTMNLIKKAVKSKVLDKLSRQRINNEAGLIYREPYPVKVLRRLHQMGVLSFIYGRVNPSLETWQRLYNISEALEWAGSRDWPDESDRELVYLCGLLYDLESEERFAIMRRLHFSKARAAVVMEVCRAAPGLLDKLSGNQLQHSSIVKRLEPFTLEGLLFMLALSPDEKTGRMIKLYLDNLRFVQPRLGGSDLQKLGLQPGPLYGEILQALREAVLDGRVRSAREEEVFMRRCLEEKREEE